jgi:hypothetical protein
MLARHDPVPDRQASVEAVSTVDYRRTAGRYNVVTKGDL